MIKRSLKDSVVKKNLKKLRKFYKKLPETIGCMECLSKGEDGCGAWCCKMQCPAFLYIEFLNTWNYIINSWKLDDIIELIEKCLRTHMSNAVIKGCVLWDSETHLCRCHNARPFNCYIYGITPNSEILPRIEMLRKKYNDPNGYVFKDQCDKVSVKDGSDVISTDDWWREINFLEQNLGIKEDEITNDDYGTYLTFHDHLLLHICPEQTLANLPKDEAVLKSFMSVVKKNINSSLNQNGKE